MAYNIQQGAQMEMPEGMTAAGTQYGFAAVSYTHLDVYKRQNQSSRQD